MIQPIIVAARRQQRQVARLVEYCRELDGTEVKVIPAEEKGLAYPHRNNAAFRQGANVMRGEPFIWLEPDSIPLKDGWVERLTRIYEGCGKPILISRDTNPPHDVVGGIGVYGPESRWLIPETIRVGGFDGWMVKHLLPLIAFTDAIQHSYARYDSNGNTKDHRFPRDRGLIREDAVIFHRDKHQDLIPRVGGVNRFFHSGDIGDIISFLPVIRHMGGGELVIGGSFDGRTMRGARFDALKPLLDQVPFLESVTCEDEPAGVTHDMRGFREAHDPRRTLTEAHARYLGIEEEIDMSPWLVVEPALDSAGRVVIARSPRYHSPAFPWRKIIDRYRRRILFVGTTAECAAFGKIGGQVPYYATRDFLELAQLIAGSDLFVGNQSAPCWVAMGLGHRLIQETYAGQPDSMVRRSNAQFCMGSQINL